MSEKTIPELLTEAQAAQLKAQNAVKQAHKNTFSYALAQLKEADKGEVFPPEELQKYKAIVSNFIQEYSD